MAGGRQCSGTLPAVFGSSDRLALGRRSDRPRGSPSRRAGTRCRMRHWRRLPPCRRTHGFRACGWPRYKCWDAAVARSLISPSIEWYEGSALAIPFPGASFDLCLCQFGLQFFPDRPAALREMFRVLQPGGRVALSVFSAIERTPVTNALADALDRRLRPGASSIKRSEHSLADADELCQLAIGQGFRDVSVYTVMQTLRFASPKEYVRMQMTATPVAGLVESEPL